MGQMFGGKTEGAVNVFSAGASLFNQYLTNTNLFIHDDTENKVFKKYLVLFKASVLFFKIRIL